MKKLKLIILLIVIIMVPQVVYAGMTLEDVYKNAAVSLSEKSNLEKEEIVGHIKNNDIWKNTSQAAVTVKLDTINHIKYMNGNNNGLFYPDNALTRAEAAFIINKLVMKPSHSDIIYNTTFSDVDASAWYADAVNDLASYGIISIDSGHFHPKAFISRAEFIKMLSAFSSLSVSDKSFFDLTPDHWAYDIILSAAQKGWILGYADGTVNPDGTLSRAEAATIVNRVLGRIPDAQTINSASGIRIFPDVDRQYWAYLNIMEASIAHDYIKENGGEKWAYFKQEKTELPAGFHVINGILYSVDSETGDFIVNRSADDHWYDEEGKYTTGNDILDRLMREATKECVKSGMSQQQKLKAVFDYTVNNFRYRAGQTLKAGSTGWTEKYAVPMFQSHRGNCYSYAAVFYYLAKNIGYNPKEAAGFLGRNRQPHGWVEISSGGIPYIYDTELTMMRRLKGYNNYMFHIAYGKSVFIYFKS